MRKFKPNLALITGASSGIGEAIARLIAAEGIPLIITGRDEVRLNEVSTDLKRHVEVTSFICHLESQSDREKLFSFIHGQCPDLIINNAGFGLYGPVFNYSIAEQLKVAEVNAMSALQITLEAANTIIRKQRKGVILNVSSAAGFQPGPYFSVYAASKAFLTNLSESLDLELKEQGVRVLAACPGQVATRFQSRASGKILPKDPWLTMDVQYAAKQIWKQICKRKKVMIFDWRYRFLYFLTHYIIPRKISGASVMKAIKSRLEK